MAAESATVLQLQLSVLPLFSLTFHKPLHGSDTTGVHMLVHPIELPIDQVEARLRSARLEEAGIDLAITRSGPTVPILSVLADFRPAPAGVGDLLDRVHQIVRALCAT